MTIRQSIISDDQVRGILAELTLIPEEIERVKNTLASKEFELATFRLDVDAEEELKRVESEAMFEILNETDGNGKKKYGNEAQRDAAMTVVLSKSQEWVDAKNEMLNQKRMKAQLTMDLAKARNSMTKSIDRYYILKEIAEVIAGLSREDTTTKRIELVERAEAIISGASAKLSEVFHVTD